MSMEQNEQLIKISIWINPRLNRLELFIIPVFFLIYALKEYVSSSFETIVVAPLGILAILYFFNAFYPSDKENFTDLAKVISKLCNISLSVVVIGIIYGIFGLTGTIRMFTIAIPVIIGGLVLSIYFKKKEPSIELFDGRMLLRLIIGLMICLAFVFFIN